MVVRLRIVVGKNTELTQLKPIILSTLTYTRRSIIPTLHL